MALRYELFKCFAQLARLSSPTSVTLRDATSELLPKSYQQPI